jgi:hypothetical protein
MTFSIAGKSSTEKLSKNNGRLALLGNNMASTVRAITANLRQRELKTEEVIATIKEYIGQQRSELRLTLPEVKKGLPG